MPSKKGKPKVKSTVKKRTLNPPDATAKPSRGAPPSEQDPKRRLGRYETAGEHAMIGGRRGIIGQTTKRFSTDNRKPSK